MGLTTSVKPVINKKKVEILCRKLAALLVKELFSRVKPKQKQGESLADLAVIGESDGGKKKVQGCKQNSIWGQSSSEEIETSVGCCMSC